jgi:dTDP-4-amino-4,6-dideoxygalactose transaminase
MYYIIVNQADVRDKLIGFLKKNGIMAVFHYLSLHSSTYYLNKHDGRELENCDAFSENLIRLPLFHELEIQQVEYISGLIHSFFRP